MAQALYRKWRSRTFEEVVGQEHVTTTLRNALRDGRVAHAYLFSGPRGTGKTSTARILAKALNCADEESRPCNTCARCVAINEGRMLDLTEIDAASNNSVDDVRELREKVGFRPSEARYKVYIIDEVHMLSASAFNALLKTLEEPPPYARFVLATTEPHRIPATVLSRCQRFDFRRIHVAEIAAHLAHIAAEEGFQAEEAALHAIARSAQGCMRDAISLLDQMTSYGAETINLEQVQQVLGSVASGAVSAFVDGLATPRPTVAGQTNNAIAESLQLIHELLLQGASLHEFAGQVVEHLRGVMLVQMAGDSSLLDDRAPETVQKMKLQAEQIPAPDVLRAIKQFSQAMQELKGGHQPQLPLELALVEVMQGAQAQEAAPVPEQPSSRPATSTPAPQAAHSPPAAPASTDRSAAQSSAPDSKKSAADARIENADATQRMRTRWTEFLEIVRNRCGPKEQASLRSVRDFAIGGDSVALAFGNNQFAQGVISETRTKDIIAGILAEMLDQQVVLTCQSGDTATLSAAAGRGRQETQASGPDPLIEFAVKELGAKVTDRRQ